MPKKLSTWNDRMILLMNHLVHSEKVMTQKEFLNSIGFMPENLSHVKRGRVSFQPEQMLRAAIKYRVNMNWLFGLDNTMMRKPSKKLLQKFRESVAEIEAIIKENS